MEFFNSWACTLLTVGCYDFISARLGAKASEGLWLSAFWGFSYIFIALAAGWMTEKLGPRKSSLSMSLLSAVTALGCMAVMAFPSIWTLFIMMLPYNFTSTSVWPAIESGLTRTRDGGGGGQPKIALGTRIALFNLSWGSAGFVAIFMRGALEDIWWGLIFVVPAGLHILGFLSCWRWGVKASAIGKEHVPDAPAEEATEAELASNARWMKRAKTLLIIAWMGNSLAYVAINVLIPLLQKIGVAAGMTDLVGGGMITSVWSFARFAGFAGVWVWAGWHYKARYLLLGQVLLAVSFLLMLTVHSQVMFVAMQIVFGMAIAMLYSAALYYAMHVSQGHGGHAGIHEALIGLGVAVGPTMGALAGQGEMNNVVAIQRIGWGVTVVLVAGLTATAWLSWRIRYNSTDKK